jgi:S1-C subfamily serine protease
MRLPTPTPFSSMIRSLLLCLSLCAAAAMADVPKAKPTDAALASKSRQPVLRTDALVRVNATVQPYDTYLPWQKQSPAGRRGLGVVMPQRRILVTAQMAADATYLELELPESELKLPARVVGIDYEANLALLEGASAEERVSAFFSDLKPIELETKAAVGDMLSTWQTSRVGDLIVTPLRISKILTASYAVEGSNYLVYEGQGILRSEGNSFTLPVVKGGKLAGFLLRYDSKNQLTTVLPALIIAQFLKDMEDGEVSGFPSLGAQLQSTMDEQFREYLGLQPDQGGMFVSAVLKGNTADKIGLKKGDIILSMNGFPIDSRGDYNDPDFGRLSMSHIVRGRATVGEELEIRILRAGELMTLKGQLTRKEPAENLVWPYLFDRGPNYLVNGGLVFQELTKPYLTGYQNNQSPAIMRLSYLADHPEELENEGRKKLVILSSVLPTPAAQGYGDLGANIVNRINGKVINQLSDAAEAFKTPVDGIHIIEFADFPRVIHLDAEQAAKDSEMLKGGRFRIGELSRLEYP